jgi:hypothetical protein
MSIRKVTIAVALASITTALILYLLSMSMPNEQALEFVPDQTTIDFSATDTPSCLAQDELERAMRDRISQASACRTDDQCVIRRYGCPFGCNTSINLTFEDRVQAAYDRYREFVDSHGCASCVYRCLPVPDPYPVCREGECAYESAS